MIDFAKISYLRSGTKRQKEAYIELIELGLLDDLASYSPILVGTIPIDIDVPDSDLDIICQVSDHRRFKEDVLRLYGQQSSFSIATRSFQKKPVTITKFKGRNFPIELFAQDTPTRQQYGYLHMMIEHRLLKKYGESMKLAVRQLKQVSGLSTEEAFASILGLKGDPYEALLQLDLPDPIH